MIADCGMRIADCCAANLAGLLSLLIFLCSGCAQTQAPTPAVAQPVGRERAAMAKDDAPEAQEPPLPSVPTGFAPAHIRVLPLTELPGSTASSQTEVLDAYVSLRDASGRQIKAPGVFRFELYQRVLRSGQPKGQRLTIWPDIDLTHPTTNDAYWRDFLRAYEFKLDTPAGLHETYILEVTYMCPDGRRLTAEYLLKGSR